MTERSYETTEAFHELLDLIRQSDKLFLEGARAVPDETSVLEGYRWLTEILSIALECYMWGDMERPTMVPIVGPTRKFSGDNADAFYYFAPLDPDRTYRIHGTRGDSVYLSLTVYGGPKDGHWSTRIVSSLNDRNMIFNHDDTFEVVLSSNEHSGNWMRLDPDSECVVTRDYMNDPVKGKQASWQIESIDPAPLPLLLGHIGELGARLAVTFPKQAVFLLARLVPRRHGGPDLRVPVPQALAIWEDHRQPLVRNL